MYAFSSYLLSSFPQIVGYILKAERNKNKIIVRLQCDRNNTEISTFAVFPISVRATKFVFVINKLAPR